MQRNAHINPDSLQQNQLGLPPKNLDFVFHTKSWVASQRGIIDHSTLIPPPCLINQCHPFPLSSIDRSSFGKGKSYTSLGTWCGFTSSFKRNSIRSMFICAAVWSGGCHLFFSSKRSIQATPSHQVCLSSHKHKPCRQKNFVGILQTSSQYYRVSTSFGTMGTHNIGRCIWVTSCTSHSLDLAG